MSGDIEIIESALLDASEQRIRVEAIHRSAYASRWDTAMTFGDGDVVGVPRRAGASSVLDTYRIRPRVEPTVCYDIEATVPCADLDPTGALVVADRTGLREPRGSLVLRIVGPNVDRSIPLGETDGWPMALRVVGRDRVAIWLLSAAGAGVFAIGHGACQEHGLERIDL